MRPNFRGRPESVGLSIEIVVVEVLFYVHKNRRTSTSTFTQLSRPDGLCSGIIVVEMLIITLSSSLRTSLESNWSRVFIRYDWNEAKRLMMMTDVGLHVLGCRADIWQTAMTETDTENGYKRIGLNSDSLTVSLSLSLSLWTHCQCFCVEVLMLHVNFHAV